MACAEMARAPQRCHCGAREGLEEEISPKGTAPELA